MYYDSDSIFASIGIMWFLFAIIALVINYILALAFEEAAIEKGFNDKKYFLYCFWLGIFGGILVAALPDKKARPAAVSETKQEQKRYDEIEDALKF